jgi:hypothetical protein
MTRPLQGNMKNGSHGRRFEDHFAPRPDKVAPLPAYNAAVVEGRSVFQHAVIAPEDSGRLLISGANHRKIGNQVTKGKWRGFPIFTLTLEERATCPRSCEHWRTCMGNSSPFSRRHRHGENLEIILEAEIAMLARRHPKGFVVRCHILGDWYSTRYIDLWAQWMRATPALHVFGYTANPPHSEIGVRVQRLNLELPERWIVRFSGEKMPDNVPRARTIWRQPESPRVAEGVVCPAQTGRVECCGSCAYCWQSNGPVVFIAHGRTNERSRKVA